MSGRMPEDMPDRMPEDMSDRMPEDLPVRKSINVMVGITRSKVIYLNSTCGKVPGYGWYSTRVRKVRCNGTGGTVQWYESTGGTKPYPSYA